MVYLKNAITKGLVASLTLILIFSCDSVTNSGKKRPISNSFKDYWYQGKSEINIYELKQYRYGELYDGEATLIYVTEDFSRQKQVKLDDSENSKDKVSVLKLNFIKKFNTGIYPYSVMTSVFSPVDYNDVIKITMSAQEWCGQVYAQANILSNNNYKFMKHSYFEKEADSETILEADYWEDEIWNLIRLDYKQLPYGTLRVIPGLFGNRTSHNNLVPQVAEGKIFENYDETIHMYQLRYPDLGIYLQIRFSSSYPHRIVSWEEGILNGLDTLKTVATIKSDAYLDYWNRNKKSDKYLRDSLDIRF